MLLQDCSSDGQIASDKPFLLTPFQSQIVWPFLHLSETDNPTFVRKESEFKLLSCSLFYSWHNYFCLCSCELLSATIWKSSRRNGLKTLRCYLTIWHFYDSWSFTLASSVYINTDCDNTSYELVLLERNVDPYAFERILRNVSCSKGHYGWA